MNLYPYCCENLKSCKGEILPVHTMKAYGEVEKVWLYVLLIIALDWGTAGLEWSTVKPVLKSEKLVCVIIDQFYNWEHFLSPWNYVYRTVTVSLNSINIWIKRNQLDVTYCIISLFNAQHVSDVNTSILRSLRLICWVISWVVLLWFDVCWYYVVVWL